MPKKKLKAKDFKGIHFSKGKYVGGYGSSNAKIAFIGEAPGKEEVSAGQPFVGPAGRKLDELCREAKIERSSSYYSNIYKYKLPYNNFDLAELINLDYQKSVNDLFRELRAIPTLNLVVALGDKALFALTGKVGITKYRGSVLPANYGEFKVLATVHPAHLLYQERQYSRSEEDSLDYVDDSNPQMKRYATPEIVVCDLVKALKESSTRKSSTPTRNLEIITDPYLLQKFLQSYSTIKDPAIDIEVSKCVPDCISIAFVPHHSVTIPLIPIAGKEGELRLEPHVYAALYQTLARFFSRNPIKLGGHNIKFDLDKIIAVSKLLSPYTRDKVGFDTSMMGGILYPELPRRLEFYTSVFTNEPYYKDEGKEFNPKKDSYKRKLIYNAKDSAVTKEIHLALNKELKDVRRRDYLQHTGANDDFTLHDFYYGYINKLTHFYMDMEAEGLLVDKARHEKLSAEYVAKRIKIHQETVKLLGGQDFNVRSHTKDIPHIVYEILGLPKQKSLGADQLVNLMGTKTKPGSDEEKILRNILDERQSYTNENYLHAAWDADGRMRSSWNPGGTETGRSSTSALKPPLRPFPKKPHKIGLAFQTLPKHGPFSKNIRSIFVAPEGYSFIERDYSQAEARIVALLADDHETLKLFDTTDIHTLTSSWLFGCGLEDVKGEMRFVGKGVRHAGNYGMGPKRLMLDTNKRAIKFDIPVQLASQDAKGILKSFHDKTPKIKRIFQKEVRDICQSQRVLWNPYGRMRMFFGYLKDEELFAQLPQSTVPDHLRHAGLRLWEKHHWLRFIMEMHDAFYWLVPDTRLQEALEVTKKEMEIEIDFGKCSIPRGKLLIPTEAKVGKRLSELETVKE